MTRLRELTWLRIGAFTTVALSAGLVVILAFAFYAVASDRDRAWDGMDAALAEAQTVREDARADRRVMRDRVDALLDQVDELRAETRLLGEQVDRLASQVRDLGGIPDLDGTAPEPASAPEPEAEVRPAPVSPAPAPIRPAPERRSPADSSSGAEAADAEPQPGRTPSHAQRKPEAGPPTHSNRGGNR